MEHRSHLIWFIFLIIILNPSGIRDLKSRLGCWYIDVLISRKRLFLLSKSQCPVKYNYSRDDYFSSVASGLVAFCVFDRDGDGADFDSRLTWQAGLLSWNGNFMFQKTCYLRDVVSVKISGQVPVTGRLWHSLSMYSTHWGRVTHIYVSDLTIIGSDNGLSPERWQSIICTNAVLLSSGPLGTNFSQIVFKIHTSSVKKSHVKLSRLGNVGHFVSVSTC